MKTRKLSITLSIPKGSLGLGRIDSEEIEDLEKKIQQAVGPNYQCELTGISFNSENTLFDISVSDFLSKQSRINALSVRAYNSLMMGMGTSGRERKLAHLLETPMQNVMRFRNFYRKSYEELIQALYAYGIKNVFDFPIGSYVGKNGTYMKIINELKKNLL